MHTRSKKKGFKIFNYTYIIIIYYFFLFKIPEELEKAIEIKTMELWQQYGSTQSEPNKTIKSDIHLR